MTVTQKATPTGQVGEAANQTAMNDSIIPVLMLPLQYSVFKTGAARHVERKSNSWSYLVKSLEQPEEHTNKESCQWIKLATFGNTRTEKGSLRHNANMQEIFGVEGDYDGEAVSIDKAAAMLRFNGIEAFIYSSPSHTETRPRWRVLAPLSKAHHPRERRRLVAMLNFALGGILADESFIDSQSYYFGKVRGSSYRTHRVSGDPIDTLDLVLGETHPQGAAARKSVPYDVPAKGPSVSLDVLGERAHIVPVDALNRYNTWLAAIASIHHETQGSDEGLEMADAISRKTDFYDRAELESKWGSFNRREGPVATITTLERMTGNVGVPAEFADCTPTNDERSEHAAMERAALDEKRREHQKKENEKIGQGAYRVPIAEKITLDSALERFVFLSEGSLVADVFQPHYALKLADWKNTYAASTKRVEQQSKTSKADKEIPVSELWHKSPMRKTATTRTFKAGGGLMLQDPDGKMAVNSWRPFDRSLHVEDIQAAGVGLFLGHIDFLFGEDAPRFLNWLAHIEQHPGVLPHTSWLHIAKHFGMGRNWLASVLARVWAGSVAANLDLVQMFKSSFNDQLSRKVLAVVDEIREGGRDSQWEHSEKLKSTITEEVRRINPKYGHTSMEFNACRWLLFSNHLSAIPLENGDRRVEVVSIEARPRDSAYYTKLYKAVESRQFVAAVAQFLGERDISQFNPGAHAVNTKAKQEATNASRTPMAEACQLLVEHWPSDFITSSDLYDVLTAGQGVGSLTAAHRRTLEQVGIHAWGKPVKIEGKATRISVLRNRARWLKCVSSDEIRNELEKVKISAFDEPAHDYLLGLVADA